MTIKSNKQILKNLLKDTEDDKIRWDVSIEKYFVKATHVITPTKNKKLTFKIVYFIQRPKETKLNIIYEINTEYSKKNMSIIDIGGKSKKAEVKEISYLLNKILLKEEKAREFPEIFIEDQFKIDDRVVVIKEQDFDKEEIGQKGTIVTELKDAFDNICYIIRFDNHFSDILIDDKESFRTGKMISGNCWAFSPENIKKIPS
jgi:hypothetical protein